MKRNKKKLFKLRLPAFWGTPGMRNFIEKKRKKELKSYSQYMRDLVLEKMELEKEGKNE